MFGWRVAFPISNYKSDVPPIYVTEVNTVFNSEKKGWTLLLMFYFLPIYFDYINIFWKNFGWSHESTVVHDLGFNNFCFSTFAFQLLLFVATASWLKNKRHFMHLIQANMVGGKCSKLLWTNMHRNFAKFQAKFYKALRYMLFIIGLFSFI